MKKMKKLFAVILSLAMVLGMSLTAFAAPETSKTVATVKGVEDGEITVTAYQIIKYNEKGYYEEVLENSIAKETTEGATQATLKPTAENARALYSRVNEIAAKGTEYVKIFSRTDNKGDFTSSELTAGTWLIVVSGETKYLYNPAIISVNKTPDGLVYGTLNLDTDSWTDELYVKKSEADITKIAESADKSDPDVSGVQFGDILKFTVTTTIPGYTSDGKDIVYKISDSLTGLKLVQNEEYGFEAFIGESENEVADDTLTAAVGAAIKDGESSFTVTFDNSDKEYLISHAGHSIKIVYYAEVTSDAEINVDELNNTATLNYSTNDGTETIEKSDETNHYTFGIDTVVDGVIPGGVFDKTGEFVKINDKGDVKYDETTGEVIPTDSKTKFLEGAEFELRIGSSDEDAPKFSDKK